MKLLTKINNDKIFYIRIVRNKRKQNIKMSFKTGMCNRHCQPLLKCPPGSHISKTRKSCVWHGRGEEGAEEGGLFSNLFGSPAKPEPVTDYDSYMRSRQSNSEPEFGGGGLSNTSRITDLFGGRRRLRMSFDRKRSLHGGRRRSSRSRSLHGGRRRTSRSRSLHSGRRRTSRSRSLHGGRRRRRSRSLHGGRRRNSRSRSLHGGRRRTRKSRH